jgi:transcriptional regulator with XRE-family HTH domain
MDESRFTPEEIALFKRVGRNIRAVRKIKRISQEHLADQCFTERSYMGLIERGKANTTLQKLKAIADALEIDPSELFKVKGK